MLKSFELLEQRLCYSAGLVSIGGKPFKVLDDDGGFQLVVPKTMPIGKSTVQSSGTFVTSQSDKALQAMAKAVASVATASESAAGFQINVNLTGTGVTDAIRAAFTAAVNKWQNIITTDIPDFAGVDDLNIDAAISPIDGVGKILGRAGPDSLRGGSFLPYHGTMQFDSADLTSLASSGQLSSVIFHEMGHVLGIGTIWTNKKVTGGTATDPRFIGSNAIAAYQALGGKDSTVPLENTGGAGTAGAHWRESVFGNEIMTGFLNSGTNPVSSVTIASLIDLGYTVDLSKADTYSLPGVTSTGSLPDLTGSIAGTAYRDANGNGTRDDGEAISSGKIVYLDTNNNGKADNGERFTTTTTDGSYSFGNLGAGTYNVRVALETGIVQTGSTSVAVSTGQAVTGKDLGTFDPRTNFSGVVYSDKNNNGTRDSGETGLSKVTIFFDTNANGILDKTERSTVTGTDGSYSFTGLAAGTYTLKVKLDTGVTQTERTSVTTTAGQTLADVNFGAYDTRGAVTGSVFNDLNNNGTREDGETALAKATVYLDANGNGKLDAGERSTATSVNGEYGLSGVLPGTYAIKVVLGAGISVSSSTGITLAAAQVLTGQAVGVFDSNCTISGIAFNDANNNGTRDTGEAVLAKNTIYIDANSNGAFDKGERTAGTGTDGSYAFTGLTAGTYKLRLLPANTALVQTTTDPLTVIAGQKLTGVNLGQFDTSVTISGTVFNDVNNNGTRDTGEVGSVGRTVFLDANDNGTLDTGEKFTTTATSGAYTFAGLTAATYKIRLKLPEGVSQTLPTENAAVTVVASAGQRKGDNLLGIYDSTGSIIGSIYADTNKNGVRDAKETGFSARTVYIDKNNNGALDTGERFAITALSGVFGFAGVPAGDYILRVLLSTGLAQTGSVDAAIASSVKAGQTTAINAIGLASAAASKVTKAISAAFSKIHI